MWKRSRDRLNVHKFDIFWFDLANFGLASENYANSDYSPNFFLAELCVNEKIETKIFRARINTMQHAIFWKT
jgi:hypothetical protein